VDVATEDRRDAGRYIASPDDVGAGAKGIALDPCPLDRLVKTQETDVGIGIKHTTFGDKRLESIPVVAFAGEATEGQPDSVEFELHRPRSVQHVQVFVARQQRVRQRRTFVVAGHHHYGHSNVSNLEQRLQGSLHQPGRHLAPIEQIAAVNHQVHLASQRRLEGETGIGEKVGPASPFLDSGLRRQVESEMRIGQQ
jgi:hypothetical protein